MTGEPSDRRLVERAREGDASAFEQLVRRHYRTVYAVTLAILHAPMDAEDATQDAFATALARLDECREPDRIGAWLGQIARRRALNALDARRVRDADSLESHMAADQSDLARDAERSELRGQLASALARLTEVQRSVVLLHDLDGRTHPEIADIVGCSAGMSRQHLFSARQLLRRLLGGLHHA